MKKRVYIETSIPSYYYEIREDAAAKARKEWTVEWWDNHRRNYDLVSSPGVIEELEKGEYPNKEQCLELIRDLPLLEITDEIQYFIEEYIRGKLMPEDPAGDALHLALASYYQCHFLLTWNCKNLANANKFEHVRHMNATLGLYVPVLATPNELMFED